MPKKLREVVIGTESETGAFNLTATAGPESRRLRAGVEPTLTPSASPLAPALAHTPPLLRRRFTVAVLVVAVLVAAALLANLLVARPAARPRLLCRRLAAAVFLASLLTAALVSRRLASRATRASAAQRSSASLLRPPTAPSPPSLLTYLLTYMDPTARAARRRGSTLHAGS